MPGSKKRPLGRGLDVLLNDTDIPDVAQGQIFFCDVNAIHPNPYQPRDAIDTEELRDLVDSISKRGVLQPIIVTPKDGEYQILAGERRWRAAKKAGLRKVPVIARDADEREHLFVALIENLQRKDLNCIEEAEAYRRLRDEFGLTQEEIATQVGKKRTTVANLLRLLSLPPRVSDYLKSGTLTLGHAKVLLSLKDTKVIEDFAEKVVSEALSVRTLEKMVLEHQGKLERRKIRRTVYKNEQDAIRRTLGARVRIFRRGARGKVVMEFDSETEMKNLVQKLIELADK